MVSFRTALLSLVGVVAVSADYIIDPNSVDMLTRSRRHLLFVMRRRANMATRGVVQ